MTKTYYKNLIKGKTQKEIVKILMALDDELEVEKLKTEEANSELNLYIKRLEKYKKLIGEKIDVCEEVGEMIEQREFCCKQLTKMLKEEL